MTTHPHHAEDHDREHNRYREVFDGDDDPLHYEPGESFNTARDEAHAEMRHETIRLVAICAFIGAIIVIVIWPAMSGTMISQDFWGSWPLWLLILGVILTPIIYHLYRRLLYRDRSPIDWAPDYMNVLVAVVVMLLTIFVILATNTAAGAWMAISGNHYVSSDQDWTLFSWHGLAAILIALSGVAAIVCYVMLLRAIVFRSWPQVWPWALAVPLCLYFAIGSALAHNAHWV